jgi:hypothetical protein
VLRRPGPSRRASFPSLGGTAVAPAALLPQGADALDLWAWTDWSPGVQPGFDRGDLRVLPGSWADPCVYMPWAGTPGDPRRQANTAPRRWPSAYATTSAPRSWLFEAALPRPAHSLSTLRRVGYPRTAQDSLPVGGQPLPGRDYTYQVHYEGFPFLSIAFSVLPSQVYPGAKRKAWGVSPRKRVPTSDHQPRRGDSRPALRRPHLSPGPRILLVVRARSAAALSGLLAVGGPHNLGLTPQALRCRPFGAGSTAPYRGL